MKTVQMRKNFSTFISDNTGEIILNRKVLLEDADCKIFKMEVKSRMVPISDPVLRERKWLKKRPSPTPIFRIKTIDTEALKRAPKRMKGRKYMGLTV